mmetsp:Transcript_55365/g.161608  ORF Transcript_55365/g.161608 Transcript_55365/m.161608 type:complete len:210 (+) Transcript_55365:1188-1817(+)
MGSCSFRSSARIGTAARRLPHKSVASIFSFNSCACSEVSVRTATSHTSSHPSKNSLPPRSSLDVTLTQARARPSPSRMWPRASVTGRGSALECQSDMRAPCQKRNETPNCTTPQSGCLATSSFAAAEGSESAAWRMSLTSDCLRLSLLRPLRYLATSSRQPAGSCKRGTTAATGAASLRVAFSSCLTAASSSSHASTDRRPNLSHSPCT